MASTPTQESRSVSEVLGEFLEAETRHRDRVTITVPRLAERLDVPESALKQSLDRLVDDDRVPVERAGDRYLVEV